MKIFISYLLLLSSFSAQALEVRLHHEKSGNNEASGISLMTSMAKPDTKYIVKFGISANEITSDQALAADNRKYIHPVYLFANLSLNYTVTPFLEAGIDFGDTLIDYVFEDDNRNVDFYYMLGLSLNINKELSLSAYYKNYDIYFYSNYPYALEEKDISVSGVSLSYKF